MTLQAQSTIDVLNASKVQNTVNTMFATGPAGTPSADVVSVQGVAGALPIPGSSLCAAPAASFTRPNDNTPLSIGDVVGTSPATNLTFSNLKPNADGFVLITDATLEVDVNAVPSGMSTFRLHLFNAAPTAIADNAAFNVIAADRAKYLGYIEIDTPVAVGDTIWGQMSQRSKMVKLAAASTTLYGVLATTAAYTPTAQAVKNLAISAMAA